MDSMASFTKLMSTSTTPYAKLNFQSSISDTISHFGSRAEPGPQAEAAVGLPHRAEDAGARGQRQEVPPTVLVLCGSGEREAAEYEDA